MDKDCGQSNTQEPRSEVTQPGKGRSRAAFGTVGMGGSAGGSEAFGEFFSHLPPDTGLAFVLVPHLESEYPEAARPVNQDTANH